MDPKEAEDCMKRCIASGLWVENAVDAEAQNQNQTDDVPEVEELKTDDEEEMAKANGHESDKPSDVNVPEKS